MPTMAEVRAKYPQYEDMSDEQLATALHNKFYSDMPFDQFAEKLGLAAESDKSKSVRDDLSRTMSDFMRQDEGTLRSVDSFMRGAADTVTFGLADEFAALGGALTGIDGDFGDYSGNLRSQRAMQAQRDDADPVASTTGRVAGALTGGIGLAKAGAPFMGPLAADAGLAAKTAQSAKAGALYSGLYGIGSGTDAESRLTEGAKSALTGAAIGGAIPVVASTIGAVTKPVRDAVKGYAFPEQYASQKIAERLSDAGLDASQAAAKMQRNPGLSLADVGGATTQNLLKTTTNIPGKAAARVKTQLAQKAMQQGDRLRSNIRTMFADPDGALAAKEKIASDAKAMAAPLYQQAYSTPVPFTRTLEDILETPAGKAALANAERIAANEQQPFQQFFINMTSPTTGTIRRVPDARGWDYIKRGFDDVIEANKAAGSFGKMNNEGRVISSLKDRMLQEIDAANPAYAAARKVWSDQSALDRAIEAGREALNQSPEATRRLMTAMSAAERESFKIGVADALRNKIGSTNFTHNALLKFFASRDQFANLRAAFADDQQFAAFRKAMFAEARKRATYNTVTGNSSTAKQLADIADAGGLRETADLARDAATGNIVGGALRLIGSRLRMLGGFTPEVADRIAQKLMTTNPQQAQAITSELQRIQQAAISADQKRQLVYRIIAPALADQATAARQQ